MLTGKNRIGSSFSGEGWSVFRAINPATGAELDPDFQEATRAEIDRAVRHTEKAFDEYRKKSGEEKARFLESIADEVGDLGEGLLRRCAAETGLPEGRLASELGRTVHQLKLFARLIREGSWVDARIDAADPERKPLARPDIRSMQRPLGPVGIFGSSNFPLAFSVAGGDTASALAAGCSVVFKAHPAHPGTCELVGGAIRRSIEKCGMPEGTFSMVHGRSTEVGLALVEHPSITAVGFTGSFRGGKALFDAANRRSVPIPVYAEMGSTNPVFILPQILRERTEMLARELSASVTQGVGQFCTNPGLVFLQHSKEGEEFKEALSKFISAVEPGVMLTREIQKSYQAGIEKLRGVVGVSMVTEERKRVFGNQGVGHVLQTGVDSFLREKIVEEEVFGPSTIAVTANTREELLQAAGALHGHLTATIHGTEKDLAAYADLAALLEQKVGRLIVNGYPTGVEVCDSMVHGGPFPATTDSRTTSVGTAAITRFTRPVCYQNVPAQLLPAELRDENPLGIWRLVNGERTRS